MSLYRVDKIILHDSCYFSEDAKYPSEEMWSTDVTCSKYSLYIPIVSDIAAGELTIQELPEVTSNTARWKMFRFWYDKIMSAPENWFL